MRVGERGPGRMQGKIRCEFARRGNMSFTDARALYNPFVGRLNRPCKFIIAHDARGKIAAAAKHDRAQRCHELAPPASRAVSPACRSRAIVWPILASNS